MRKPCQFLLVLLLVIAVWQPCAAEVDLEVLKQIDLEGAPLDMAVSQDGRWIYVLTDDARLEVYSHAGTRRATVPVPAGSQRIAGSPEEDVLLVANPANRTLQVVRVNLEYSFTSAQSPSKGPPEAPVTLVLFTDFECPFCAQLAPILDEVHQQYPREVRIVFKNYPLRSHPFAAQASLAALAAEEQGQFWPFHDRLFQNYNRLNPQKVEEIRQALNLDAERFRARMNDPALKTLVIRDMSEGNEAGVSGTPTLFVNGKKVRGRLSLEELRKVIEAVLSQSKTSKK